MYGRCSYPDNSMPCIELKDYGPAPISLNIEAATKQNNTFRTTLWTGDHLQLTLMCIPAGGEIGPEMHPGTDQFLRIEQGRGIIMLGETKDNLCMQKTIRPGDAIVIPAGTWHNLINAGSIPLKLYSIYAPPQHPKGTVHVTKADAMAHEHTH